MKTSFNSIVTAAVLITLLAHQTTAIFPDVQGFDIFSGEHLDDTILPSNGSKLSFVHAVLVIYQTDCIDLLTELNIRADLLPMSKYVLLLWHDYSTSNTHTWYGFRGDDLRSRYDATHCLDVMFLPKGSTSLSSIIRWSPVSKVPFSEWVWEQIVVAVKINNYFGAEIRVRTIHSGHSIGFREYPDVTLAPEERITLDLYESTVIHIYMRAVNMKTTTTEDKLVGYWIVNGSLTINVIPSKMDLLFEDVMFQIQEDTRLQDYHALETAWNSMQRHLLNLKQPLIVPQFTDTGYKKMKVPGEWFDVLRNFYDTHRNDRVGEEWTFGDTVVNQGEVSHCF